MGKLLTSILAGVLTLTAPSCSYHSRRTIEVSQRVGVRMNVSWERLITDCKPRTLGEISSYLEDCIDSSVKYPDFFRSAKRTVDDGKGDCKDNSALACCLAQDLGYKPMMLVLQGQGESNHAVCLLERIDENANKKYGVIDREILVSPEFDSKYANNFKDIPQLINFLNKIYVPNRIRNPHKGYVVVDLNLIRGWRESSEDLSPQLNRILRQEKFIPVK
ncbi:MAG: hypothetical protein KKB21_02915 [Nanoarchaeota archaeon]|nr:hypothetical protein [Nanoarchaeota archaeon]MBU4086503.1 hypothetical protein [Nanoarchaeota archaeon]